MTLKIFEKLSVLFVEDEKDFVFIIKTFLSDVFRHVEVAYDGVEGLNAYGVGKYDVIITDITMPSMNGFEMSEKIKAICPTQKIVALSAHKEEEWLAKAKEVGIDLYLHKPIGVDELLIGLEKVISIK
jgi:CheY-like chemotaxis protein